MDTNIEEPVEREEEQEDATLAAALRGEFKSAPWYVSSVAIHALIFLLMMMIPVEGPPSKARQITITSMIDVVEEEILEEPVNDIVENDPEVTNNTESTEPSPIIVTTDFEVADHNETADDMDNNSAKGDPDSVTTFDGDVSGTPALMGVGNKGGGGGGSRFGSRLGGGRRNLVAKGRGSRKTEGAVELGLKWLAEHQEADGRWDCQKYGGAGYDVAVTSMSVLAFLGSGNSTKFGKYKNTVCKAVYWLTSKQEAAGNIGQHRYEAGISLMAMAEAYGMSSDANVKASAQKCVDWAVKAQCPSGGWNYTPTSGRVDTSVTGWWVMGLKSAKVAGLNVPYDVFDKALKYIDKATSVTNDGGYGGASVSYATENAATVDQVQSGGGSTRMTAVSLTCLQFLGKAREDVKVQSTMNQIMKDGVPTVAGCDFYRWYYATLGLFQMGVKTENWKTWIDALTKALLEMQVKDGTAKENKGSWPPEPEQSPGKGQWGRVGQTALGCLMLEVFYRYEDIHTHPITKQQK